VAALQRGFGFGKRGLECGSGNAEVGNEGNGELAQSGASSMPAESSKQGIFDASSKLKAQRGHLRCQLNRDI